MAKLKGIIDDLFLIEKSIEKSVLKIFYNIDVSIHNPEKQETAPITNTSNEVAQAPDVIQKQKTESFRNRIKQFLNEEDPNAVPPIPPVEPAVAPAPTAPVELSPEPPAPEEKPKSTEPDFVKKAKGVLNISKDEANDIQTLEDVLSFTGDKKDKDGTKVLDDVSVELILAMSGASNTPLQNIIKKEDKVMIEILYGAKEDSSIGLKVLKRTGVSNVSIVMIKNKEIINAPFNLKTFNDQLVEFRNDIMRK